MAFKGTLSSLSSNSNAIKSQMNSSKDPLSEFQQIILDRKCKYCNSILFFQILHENLCKVSFVLLIEKCLKYTLRVYKLHSILILVLFCK